MAYIAANDQQSIAAEAVATALAAPAVRTITPPEGDATPQTHAAVSLTG